LNQYEHALVYFSVEDQSNSTCKSVNFVQMYILKVKGTAKIPDYVQLRDDQFTLLAYFRVDRPEKAITKAGLGAKEAEIIKLINEMPFGKIQKLPW
jgi:hypothetical protein